MSIDAVSARLAPYRQLAAAEAFAESLRRLVPLPGDTDDPAEFWRNLMVSVELHCLSTSQWKDFFLEGTTDAALDASPRAAILTILDSLSKQAAIDAQSAGVLAEAYLKLGQLAAAEHCAAVSFALGERSPAVLGLLVGRMLRERALPEARELVALSGKLHPGGPETRFGEARLLLSEEDLGKADEGLGKLEAFVADFPLYRPAWDLLLNNLTLREEWDRAARVGDKAPAPFRGQPEFLKKLAAVELRRQNPERAGALLREAAQALKAKGNATARETALLQLDQAELELHLGRGGKAAELAAQALPSLGEDPDALVRAVELLLALGQAPPQAAQAIRAGLDRHPGHEGLLFLEAKSAFDAGRDQEAFDRLQALAEKNPGRTDAIFLMALLCLRNRQFAAAAELAAAVAQTDPERATEAWIVVADASRLQGRADEAVEALTRALERCPPGHPAREEIFRRMAQLEKILKKT